MPHHLCESWSGVQKLDLGVATTRRLTNRYLNMVTVTSNRFALRMRIENWVIIPLHFQPLFYDSWVSGCRSLSFTSVDVDSVSYWFRFLSPRQDQSEIHLNAKSMFAVKSCLTGSSAYPCPLLFAALSPFLSEHFSQAVASADGMKHPNGVPHVALA